MCSMSLKLFIVLGWCRWLHFKRWDRQHWYKGMSSSKNRSQFTGHSHFDGRKYLIVLYMDIQIDWQRARDVIGHSFWLHHEVMQSAQVPAHRYVRRYNNSPIFTIALLTPLPKTLFTMKTKFCENSTISFCGTSTIHCGHWKFSYHGLCRITFK